MIDALQFAPYQIVTKSVYNSQSERQNWTLEQQKMVPGRMNYIFFNIRWMCILYLRKSWEQDALWEEGSVMLWPMFCWETLGPAFMWMLLWHLRLLQTSSSPSQQDNAPCHTANIVQGWFEEHDKEFGMLCWSLIPPI